MSDEIIAMQTQLSFQEDSIQALNEVVTKQQREIDTLKKMLQLLQENLEEMTESQGEIIEDNTPPPHY